MTQKEELRIRFDEQHCEENVSGNTTVSSSPQEIFDFFYSEIEAREAEIMKLGDMVTSIGKVLLKPNEKEALEAKISQLQSTLVAADDVIQASGDLSTYNTHHSIVEKYKDKLNAYHQLKTKSQS